jgi:hypothetical protein
MGGPARLGSPVQRVADYFRKLVPALDKGTRSAARGVKTLGGASLNRRILERAARAPSKPVMAITKCRIWLPPVNPFTVL